MTASREHWNCGVCVLVLLACLWPGAVRAQRRPAPIEEPQWLKLRLTEASAGLYSEGSFEETSFGGDSTVSHDRFFIGPSLGLNLDGSIYHPNLCRLLVLSEGALGWETETIRSATGSVDRDKFQYLGRFNGNAHFLNHRPFNGSLFGNYDHTFRDYDFFSRVTVDSWRYGGRVNYREGPLYLTALYTHRDEDVSGQVAPSSTREDTVGFDGRLERARGQTALTYTFLQYDRSDIGRTGSGTDHTVTISDSERFGSREQFRFNGNASYTRRDTDFESSDQISTGASFAADHRRNLSSFYSVNYDRFDLGDFASDNVVAQGQLRHQLYESLTSTLLAQGSSFEAGDHVSEGYTRRYGAGFSEAYTKRLGARHRLRINNSLLVERVESQGISRVENEPHSFSSGGGGAPPDSFFLNLPNVNEATIEVTDQNDTPPPYVRGLDYDVIRLGTRTLIQRLPGSRIPSDATVLVDYEAEPTPAGEYTALSEQFSIRVDLWDNLWGLYGRLTLYANTAPEELHVQDLVSYAVGTDVNWRWARAGAEFEIYDSSEASYRSARLFQSFSFKLDPVSTLGVDFTETWTDYVDANRQEQHYRAITRYRRMVGRGLTVDADAGVALRRGRGVDQTLATFRPNVQYRVGRMTLAAGYNLEYELFLDREERIKHLLFLRLRRTF
jgi:hypothetical protein